MNVDECVLWTWIILQYKTENKLFHLVIFNCNFYCKLLEIISADLQCKTEYKLFHLGIFNCQSIEFIVILFIQGANFYSKLSEIISADLLTCGMLTYVIKSMFTVFGMIELLRNLICFEKKNLQRKPNISKKKQAW